VSGKTSIIVGSSGIYRASYQISYSPNSDGNRESFITVNNDSPQISSSLGGERHAFDITNGQSGCRTNTGHTCLLSLSSGDVLRVFYKTTSGAVNSPAQSWTDSRNYFSINKI